METALVMLPASTYRPCSLGCLAATAPAARQAADELGWSEPSGRACGGQRWLFTARQQRLSLAQMDTYEAHSRAAQETDEDFFDNFS